MNGESLRSIEENRKKVDEIDEAILDLLVKRFQATSAIGRVKKEEGIQVLDVSREDEVLERRAQLATDGGFERRVCKETLCPHYE
jgi:chorismate mutase